MTFRTQAEVLTGTGYCPRTTPVDVLMGAPLNTHLQVAEAMEDDGDYPDYDMSGMHFEELEPNKRGYWINGC